MPLRRKPVSPLMRASSVSQIFSASIASGISRSSRPITRTQPQLRLDCSAPGVPFSQSTTSIPRSARKRAVLTPMMPPPTMTTSALAGRVVSVAIGSSVGPGMGRALSGRRCRGHRCMPPPRDQDLQSGRRRPALGCWQSFIANPSGSPRDGLSEFCACFYARAHE